MRTEGKKGTRSLCVCVATGLLLCVNGSVEKGGFEQQNKLMEAEGNTGNGIHTHTRRGCH